MAFDIDFDERGAIRQYIGEFLLQPSFWSDPPNQITLPLTWTSVQFSLTNKPSIPNNSKGVYCFTVRPTYNNFIPTEYLFYVGKTTRDFRKRYGEYLDDEAGKRKPRWKVYKLLKLYKGYLYFHFASIGNNGDIDIAEEMLLNTFVPKANTNIPKVKIKPELIDIYIN